MDGRPINFYGGAAAARAYRTVAGHKPKALVGRTQVCHRHSSLEPFDNIASGDNLRKYVGHRVHTASIMSR